MIINLLNAILTNQFLQTAIFAAIAASFAGGVVGSYVVSKRIVFISGSISHAVLGGIGLFVFLHFPPLLGALLSAVVFAILIGTIHLKFKDREDTVIAAIWSIGMATGVIFISLTPGANNQLMDFLFGNLLWATKKEIWMLISLDVVILILSKLYHRRFLSICFDETQSRLQKQPVSLLYFILLTLVAITVVLMIQIVGAILVITMLCLPAAIANFFTTRLSKIILLAIILSCLFSIVGILLSYVLDWPPGSTITLVITICYFLSLPLKIKSA